MMAIAGGAVQAVRVKLDAKGVLVEVETGVFQRYVVESDLDKVIAFLDQAPQGRSIIMKLEGTNLSELRKAFA